MIGVEHEHVDDVAERASAGPVEITSLKAPVGVRVWRQRIDADVRRMDQIICPQRVHAAVVPPSTVSPGSSDRIERS